MVRFAPDFALCEEDQPALAQPEGGTFLAFVLLEQRSGTRRNLSGPCGTTGASLHDGGEGQRGGGKHPGL